MPGTGPISNARSMNASSRSTVWWQTSRISLRTALVKQSRSFTKAWNSWMMPSQWRLSSRTLQRDDLAHALHLVEAREVHQHREAGEQLQPLGEAAEHGERLGDVLVGVDAEGGEIIVLVLHLLILEEGRIFALGHADRVEQVRVGGDVDRLHVGEGGQHHLDLGRLEHAAIFVVVAILHLDVGLGEEAEDLGQQVALVVGQLLRPVAAILAERHLLRHPVDLLLALPEFERPGIFERLVLLAGFEKGISVLHEPLSRRESGRSGAAPAAAGG